MERNEITDFTPTRVQESVSDWGLQFTGYYRKRLATIRYSIGRFMRPSTFGTRTTTDQIRVQYTRPLTPLLTFDGAVRMTRDDRVDDTTRPDRDRVLAELSLTRMLTSTWSISAEYRYTWQDLGGIGGKADNNGVFIAVGYQGLKRAQPWQDD
jgi:hypothetical protein